MQSLVSVPDTVARRLHRLVEPIHLVTYFCDEPTDALMALTARRKIYGYEFEGVRHDLGDRVGFISAQIGFGLKRPDLADRLRAYLKSVISQE